MVPSGNGRSTLSVGVVGAGLAGLAAARELLKAGFSCTIFEESDQIGGLWNRVYDTCHYISSKNSTYFADYKMPAEYPDFPSAAQVREYVGSYAASAGILPHIEFRSKVVEAVPIDEGMSGWRIRLADGSSRELDVLVVATGHLRYPIIPEYPGEYSGRTFHSVEYRNPTQLGPGTVLIVGFGNSAADIAVDAAAVGSRVLLSVRHGGWVLPKTFFGIPRGDITFIGKLPPRAQAVLLKALVLTIIGHPTRYGLPPPTVKNFVDRIPTISNQLPYWLQHGRISVRPEIRSFSGRTVNFVDGSSDDVDIVVWATGYEIKLPFFPEGIIQWLGKVPARKIGGILPPNLANLFFCGFVAPRGGGPLAMSEQGRVICSLIDAQALEKQPLGERMFKDVDSTARMDYSLREWKGEIAMASDRLARYLSETPKAAVS